MSIVLEAVLAVVLAGVAAIVIAVAVKLFKGLSDGAGRSDDARVIQEIYQGISRMEERIATLETILFDRKKEGRDL